MSHYYRSYLTPKYLSNEDDDGSVQVSIVPFTLEHIIGAVVLWAVGVTLAGMAFCMEKGKYRMN